MDIAQVATLLAAASALAGAIWAILGGRNKLASDNRVTAFEQAMQLLDAKTNEIDRLNQRMGTLERRDRWRERRERKLIMALARYAHQPQEMIESDLDDPNDEEPTDFTGTTPPTSDHARPPGQRSSPIHNIFEHPEK